jgi:hypothetical protein
MIVLLREIRGERFERNFLIYKKVSEIICQRFFLVWSNKNHFDIESRFDQIDRFSYNSTDIELFDMNKYQVKIDNVACKMRDLFVSR